jgi:two-component system OmpR family response regulator
MTAPKRVLIVEDDVHIAELLMLHLRGEGYAVEHAADGDHGLRLLRAHHWDALVLDLMLPGTEGLEICRQARGLERYTPTIITSARGSEMHRVLGLEIGADDYLAKPFSVLELVARLKALLRRVDALARAPPGKRCSTARPSISRRASSTCSTSSSRTRARCSRAASSSTAFGGTGTAATSTR